MQSFKTIVAFLILLGVILYGKNLSESAQKPQQSIPQKQEPTVTSSPTNTPTSMPTPTPLPTPTIKKPQGIGISDLFYPGAKQISFDDNILILESLDDPDKITEWYEEKIKQLAMNAKSFSKTSANGNVLNTLVASDGKTEIRVEITKQKKQKSTKIVVTVKTS